MKRNMSICILILFLLVILLFILWNFINLSSSQLPQANNPISTESEEEVLVSSTSETPYAYIIFETDGRLTAYYSDNVTVFMETGIPVWKLPDPLKEELKTGIRFETEHDLYEFLESYSS